jgi:F-type H+-transporting ATPase subunit a
MSKLPTLFPCFPKNSIHLHPNSKSDRFFLQMTNKINTSGIKQLVFTLFLTFVSVFGFGSADQQHEEHSNRPVNTENHPTKEAGIDISKVAFEHILDTHSWHLWGDGHEALAIPLPVILKTANGLVTFMSSEFHHDIHGKVVVEKNGERFVNFEDNIYYASENANEEGEFLETNKDEKGEVSVLNASPLDFSITKNVAQLFLSALALVLIFTSMARSYKKHGITTAPKGKQAFLEPLVVFVRDDLAKDNIGPKGEKFVPYLLTVFFLILINNLFGLVPISANLTGNIGFTVVLAFFTFVLTNINGNKHYWSHIFLPHAPKAIWPILIPLEIIGTITKPFALMIRLFANMTAGHLIVISLVGLIFIFKSLYIAPVSIAFALFIDILEVLVAFLQAYIFTMLTSIFIGSAVADPTEDGMHNKDDEGLAEAH